MAVVATGSASADAKYDNGIGLYDSSGSRRGSKYRIDLPRTRVNKGKDEGRGCCAPAPFLSSRFSVER